MSIIESVFLASVYISFFVAIFCAASVVFWALGKIGFMHWLRGWLWYFGLIDECPDAQGER